ncbi:hypothetical protein D3C86_1690360 [compost metagenome]
MPWACKRSAASAWATTDTTSQPNTSASSSVLGLISHGAALSPARSASPLVSRATFRPRLFNRTISACNHSGLTPCGRLPATTTASCPGAICSSLSINACCAAASTCGPGPLMSVMRPSLSASLMLLRISPGTRMKASTKPRLANRVSNACRLSSPRKPLTVS